MPNEILSLENGGDREAGELGSRASYEAPRLVPLGNLKDILAGGGSQECDGSIDQPGTTIGTC